LKELDTVADPDLARSLDPSVDAERRLDRLLNAG